MGIRGWPRAVRLRQRADFVAVQEGGARASTPLLLLRFRGSPSGEARVGLTVSRKVGNAVTRNRVKRWLREVLRHRREALPAGDLVVIAKNTAAEAGLEALAAEVDAGLARLARGPRGRG